MEPTEFYRRNLPHFQPAGGTFFVTFNLYGSLPKPFLEKMTNEYELLKIQAAKKPDVHLRLADLREQYFQEQDDWLDKSPKGPHFLKDERIATLVANTLHHWDGRKYELIAFCIMSNHVHVVLRLFGEDETETPVYLHKILHSIKRFSAIEANKILGRAGKFWQYESFDYRVRNEVELKRVIQYTLHNPVKAGLCQQIKDWRWSYIKPEYDEFT